MRFFTASITSLFLAGAALAVPLLAPIESYAGETTGRHIVQLKEGAVLPAVLEALRITPEYQWKQINGFAGIFDETVLPLIRASPDVEMISEDGILHASAVRVQEDAPWGLARMSQRQPLAGENPDSLGYRYRYDESAGSGVDIYIVDSGIQVTHNDFGGRARWGKSFGGYADQDGLGHGTYCAGIAAGTVFGVAKKANLIAVKVLSDVGSGSLVDVISGMDWVVEQAKACGRPSVMSMSLGGPASTAMDYAVARSTASGVHVIVAAGNDNQDAATTSPARAPSAITVGATTVGDERASFSNYGPVVDIFAPGHQIYSAYIGSNEAIMMASGTSAAAPHISGLVAYLIGLKGDMTPEAMSAQVKSLSQPAAIYDIPANTANLLAQNDLA